MHTTVIAEPGSTHEGDYHRMVHLLELAAAVGCDVYKVQWVSSPDELCRRRRAPAFLDDYRKISYPLEWHSSLRRHAARLGLGYACSVYLPQDVAVMSAEVDYLKCSSFEVDDWAMLAALQPYRDRVIISTGMSTARPQGFYAVLHCVSAYPAPCEAMNLAVLRDPYYSGLSDHTLCAWTGALAVAAGARIIEFHLRLASCPPTNADYVVSRDPLLAKSYVDHIRRAEQMLGDGIKRIQPCEQPMRAFKVT